MSDHTPVVLPWYRHRWPWFLMAGPAIVVVAGVITLWLAIRSNDGLVADDYYKQGLAINQTTARDQQATRLGLQAELMIGGSGREIRVMLRSQTAESLPDSLLLRVMHPTRSRGRSNARSAPSGCRYLRCSAGTAAGRALAGFAGGRAAGVAPDR